MLPTAALKTICLSQGNFVALMGTTIAITAAATFWCTRGCRGVRCFWNSCKPVNNTSNPQVTCPTSNPAVSSAAPVSAVSAKTPVVVDETLSYLCNSCGTEKYSPDQLAAPTTSSSAASKSPYKMVILVRTDLNMGKGKVAAQCCHAVLAAFKSANGRQSDALKRWEREGQPKITLKIETEDEMIELMGKARSAGIVAESIRDAGRTQVAAGTRTVCAIGPAPAKLIDTITGHLKLY